MSNKYYIDYRSYNQSGIFYDKYKSSRLFNDGHNYFTLCKYTAKIIHYLISNDIDVDDLTLDEKIKFANKINQYSETKQLLSTLKLKIYDDLEKYASDYSEKNYNMLTQHTFNKVYDLHNRLKAANIHVLFRFHPTNERLYLLRMTIIICKSSNDYIPVRELWYGGLQQIDQENSTKMEYLPHLININEWIDEININTKIISYNRICNRSGSSSYNLIVSRGNETKCGHTYICDCKFSSCDSNHRKKSIDPNKCIYCENMDTNECTQYQNIEESDNICPITHCKITTPFKLKCSHTFEKVAILEWCKKNNSCPICRANICQ